MKREVIRIEPERSKTNPVAKALASNQFAPKKIQNRKAYNRKRIKDLD